MGSWPTHWFSQCLITQLGGDVQCAVLCRFDGVTAYQTDWSIAAVTLHAQGSPLQPEGNQPFNLPMASLEGQPGVALVGPYHTQHNTAQHNTQQLSLVSQWLHCGVMLGLFVLFSKGFMLSSTDCLLSSNIATLLKSASSFICNSNSAYQQASPRHPSFGQFSVM